MHLSPWSLRLLSVLRRLLCCRLLISCCCFNCVAVGVYLSFCGVVVILGLWSCDHLMHVCSSSLDLRCILVVASVFVVLLCRVLTTKESRVKVWRL